MAVRSCEKRLIEEIFENLCSELKKGKVLVDLFLSFSGEWEVVSRAGCPGPQCPDFLPASCKSRALVEVMSPLIQVHCSYMFIHLSLLVGGGQAQTHSLLPQKL